METLERITVMPQVQSAGDYHFAAAWAGELSKVQTSAIADIIISFAEALGTSTGGGFDDFVVEDITEAQARHLSDLLVAVATVAGVTFVCDLTRLE